MQLFALYVGGKAPKSLIEVHDVFFCIAKDIEHAQSMLRKKWWGLPNQVHIDSYIILTSIDGHKIELVKEPFEESKKLFFVHFGGYYEHLFGEVHQSAFFIAEDAAEAIRKGRNTLCVDLLEQHLDSCVDVENILNFDEMDGYYLHFIEDREAEVSKATPGYLFLSCV